MNLARVCCCAESVCDCEEVTAVTVSWGGSVTFEAVCGEWPECDPDSGNHWYGSGTFSSVAVVAVQVRGSSTCAYEGVEELGTITMTNCFDEGSGPSTFDIAVWCKVEVFFVFPFNRWFASLEIWLVPPVGFPLACSGKVLIQCEATTAGGTCPPLEAYPLDLDNSTAPTSDLCSIGCPFVSAYTASGVVLS